MTGSWCSRPRLLRLSFGGFLKCLPPCVRIGRLDMDVKCTLAGTLVRVVPLSPDDFPALYKAASDPLIWEQNPEPTRYLPEVFSKFFAKIMSLGGPLSIVEIASGRIIGTSSYYNYDAVQRHVSIGYTFLERSFWDKAYNREVKSLMLDHAFRFVDKVLFEVGANNLRSQKALGNIGATFVHETTLPSLDGTPMPYFVFSIHRSRFCADSQCAQNR